MHVLVCIDGYRFLTFVVLKMVFCRQLIPSHGASGNTNLMLQVVFPGMEDIGYWQDGWSINYSEEMKRGDCTREDAFEDLVENHQSTEFRLLEFEHLETFLKVVIFHSQVFGFPKRSTGYIIINIRILRYFVFFAEVVYDDIACM